MKAKSKTRLCAICSKPFKYRHERIYCSDQCREQGWWGQESYAERETVYVKAGIIQCFYCGSVADTIDHIPPKAYRLFIIRSHLIHQYPFETVNSCRECNSALGAKALWTKRERKEFIKQWLNKKYVRFLHSPEWNERELNNLGPNLKMIINKHSAIKKHIKQRIAW